MLWGGGRLGLALYTELQQLRKQSLEPRAQVLWGGGGSVGPAFPFELQQLRKQSSELRAQVLWGGGRLGLALYTELQQRGSRAQGV